MFTIILGIPKSKLIYKDFTEKYNIYNINGADFHV